jgi:hypothetical protein
MNFLVNSVVLWFISCLVMAFIFIKTICDHLRFKAVSSVTIIDLAYSDCMISLFCFGLTYSAGIIECLLNQSQTLDFVPSLVIGEAMFISVCYILCGLTITAILRLTSLVRNSEQFGIQGLGPDDVAIWKIRMISVAISFGIPLTGLLFFQSIPGFFVVLANYNSIPLSEIAKLDPYNFAYIIPIFIAAFANLLPKIYSTFLVKKLKTSTESHSKFLISLNIAIAFSFIISTQILSSYLSRVYRLHFYYPMVVFFSCDLIPLVIIMKNPSMMKRLEELFPENIQLTFKKIRKFNRRKIYPYLIEDF